VRRPLAVDDGREDVRPRSRRVNLPASREMTRQLITPGMAWGVGRGAACQTPQAPRISSLRTPRPVQSSVTVEVLEFQHLRAHLKDSGIAQWRHCLIRCRGVSHGDRRQLHGASSR